MMSRWFVFYQSAFICRSLSTGSVRAVSEHVMNLLHAAQFEPSDEFPPVLGSWYKKWFAKTVDVARKPEVADRIAKLERALELRGLDKPQSEVDKVYLDAAANMIKSVENVPHVALQIGPLLFLKTTTSAGSQIQVKKLSGNQLLALEKNQSWLSSPIDVLQKLDAACQDNKSGTDMRHVTELDEVVKQLESTSARYRGRKSRKPGLPPPS